MWEFRKANTFGALAFTSYGAFWLSFAAFVKFVAPGLGGGTASATGLYLLGPTSASGRASTPSSAPRPEATPSIA